MAQLSLTARQAAFVTAIKAGCSQTQAYIDAGYSPNGANGHAARLVATGSVQRALAEHQQRELARADYDADRWLVSLLADMEAARAAGMHGTLPKYYELLARRFGLFADNQPSALAAETFAFLAAWRTRQDAIEASSQPVPLPEEQHR